MHPNSPAISDLTYPLPSFVSKAVLVAASSPNPQLIQLLCAQLADVNCSDRSHRTPLAAASAVGGDAAVGALLAANAQVDGAPLVAAALAGRN